MNTGLCLLLPFVPCVLLLKLAATALRHCAWVLWGAILAFCACRCRYYDYHGYWHCLPLFSNVGLFGKLPQESKVSPSATAWALASVMRSLRIQAEKVPLKPLKLWKPLKVCVEIVEYSRNVESNIAVEDSWTAPPSPEQFEADVQAAAKRSKHFPVRIQTNPEEDRGSQSNSKLQTCHS